MIFVGSDSIPLLIIFIICVIGGAYFAAAESAFSAVNKIKIKSLADDGNRKAKGAMGVVNNFEKALTTLLIGNNVTKIAGASVSFWIPTFLTDGNSLIYGQKSPDEYMAALIITAVMTLVLLAFSLIIFNKKQL